MPNIKWKDGFRPKKCEHTQYCKGVNEFDTQCTQCGRLKSKKTGARFHNIKLAFRKAFHIINFVFTAKNHVGSVELTRRLELRTKSYTPFNRKMTNTMESIQNSPIMGKVEVNETNVSGQGVEAFGRNVGKRKIRIVSIERALGGVCCWYGSVFDTGLKNQFWRI